MTPETQRAMPGQPIRVQVEGHGIVEFPAGTSESEMRQALEQLQGPTPAAVSPTSKEGVLARLGRGVKSAAVGFGKGTMEAAGDVMGGLGTMFPGVNYTPADDARVEQATRPEGTAQTVGYGAEKVLETAMTAGPGVVGAVRAIPRQARAAVAFKNVMAKAKDIPIEVSGPTNIALRIKQLSERGGSMPKVVRDFLKRVNEPGGGALTYGEARDFATNISRLSSNEYQRLTPIMQKELHALRVSMNSALKNAADKVGMGDEFMGAMDEYTRAARFGEHLDRARQTVVKGAAQTLPYAAGAAGGYYLSRFLGGR